MGSGEADGWAWRVGLPIWQSAFDLKRTQPNQGSGMNDGAEMLFHRRSPTATPDALAYQLGRLMWQGTENGASIRGELAEWIEHGDAERASIALALDEGLLFRSPEQMSAALDRLAVRLPQLRQNIEAKRSWLRENIGDRRCPISTRSGRF